MKSLIILALISYTLQIDHCIKEVKVCDSCKSGFNFKYYSAIYCEKIAIPFCDTMSGDNVRNVKMDMNLIQIIQNAIKYTP